MPSRRPLHLAAVIDGAGWHPAAWREPGADPAGLFGGPHWIELVRELDAAGLDFVTLEDSHRLQSTRPDGPDDHVDRVRGRLDAIMLAAWLAPLTTGIGIVPAASTTLSEPYLLASQIATIDFASLGRAGWEATVAGAPGDAAYVGPRTAPVGADAWAEADEHVEIVRALWDSWEDGAEIRDAVAHRFIDRDRVHRIDFVGDHLSVVGPSITPRPPQGQPVVVAVDGDELSTTFAARAADVIVVAAPDEGELAPARRRLDEALAAAGRDPDGVRVLVGAAVLLDVSGPTAEARRRRLDATAGASPVAGEPILTGSAAELAERLLGWQALGYDGARLRPGAVPHDLVAIARELAPELRSRGARLRRPTGVTLRDALGFSRPANRLVPDAAAGAWRA